jgi:hypothetical protein
MGIQRPGPAHQNAKLKLQLTGFSHLMRNQGMERVHVSLQYNQSFLFIPILRLSLISNRRFIEHLVVTVV